MKKILSMLLCLILASGMLVSCTEDEIGSYLPNYDDLERPAEVEELTLNMYIITEDETVENAKTTVEQLINAHTTTQYSTVINIHYLSETDYAANVLSAVDSTDENAANIVLINSKELFDTLYINNLLADLTPYFNSDKFGTLNVQITNSLLESSKMDGRFYAVPNNRIVGEYEYLVIDKEIATKTLFFKDKDISSYKSLDDAKELIDAIDARFGEGSHVDKVYTFKGGYEEKAKLEDQGYVCTVISKPYATPETTFESAFAVVNRETKYVDRSMEIIYAINNDIELRNLLQYGVKGTNYTVDAATGDIIRVKDADNIYSMKLLYTGDLFKASYCTELGWVESLKVNGTKQNADSVVYTEPAE